MKLKDAIRYYELTGSDILADTEKQSKYVTALDFGYVFDDFTEVMEGLYDNLLLLWCDSHEITDETVLPTKEELSGLYLHSIPKQESESTTQEFEMPSKFALKVKRKEENKIVLLLVSILTAEMNIEQFYDMEIETVVEIINAYGEKMEAEQKKRKKNKHKL
ncbi:hypothetical protein [Lactococcus formosensis]|uniref:hypothetical protein n=1 Tax=Lactococcus formosensis TaxID=1281486 RepID=UPI0022DFD24A|nr:hypothetical protein [Lactococcus formosensis]